jgi:hypothetical protein
MTPIPHASPPHAPQGPWEQWFERYHGGALHQSGADPDYLGRLIVGLLFPAKVRRCLRIVPYLPREEIVRLIKILITTLASIVALERLRDDLAFTQLEVSSRHDINRLLRQSYSVLRGCTARIDEAHQRADADDPLLPLLRLESPTRRRRGKPAQPLSTLFMVLLSEHIKARHGKPRYVCVGRVAVAMFPQCFEQDVQKDRRRLATCVLDRCRKFRERYGHDLPRLREAVLSITDDAQP